MTAPSAEISSVLKEVGEFCEQRPQGAARVLGVHLEGPYINPGKLGAQPNFAHTALMAEVEEYLALAPIRVIKGPKTQLWYPSSVFVDQKNDELWVANFGNHRATVYPRKAEGNAVPIRVIRTGPEEVPAPTLANVRIAYDTKREQILAPN